MNVILPCIDTNYRVFNLVLFSLLDPYFYAIHGRAEVFWEVHVDSVLWQHHRSAGGHIKHCVHFPLGHCCYYVIGQCLQAQRWSDVSLQLFDSWDDANPVDAHEFPKMIEVDKNGQTVFYFEIVNRSQIGMSVSHMSGFTVAFFYIVVLEFKRLCLKEWGKLGTNSGTWGFWDLAEILQVSSPMGETKPPKMIFPNSPWLAHNGASKFQKWTFLQNDLH